MANSNKATYIMVPRSLIRTWFVVTIVQLILIGAAFQYANYVDSRSNRQLCGVVRLFNNTYDKAPPPTDAGKLLQGEMFRIYNVFKCK